MHGYPRTQHLPGSRGGSYTPPTVGPDATFVIEEKLDGAHLTMWVEAGTLRIGFRGRNPLPRHPAFSRVTATVMPFAADLVERLGTHYELHAEWCVITHTVYYGHLQADWYEMDIRDVREASRFLDTNARHALLAGTGIVPVPVLGRVQDPTHDWMASVRRSHAAPSEVPAAVRAAGCISDGRMEGLYVKAERAGEVIGRFKWIDPQVAEAIERGPHWRERALICNGVDR